MPGGRGFLEKLKRNIEQRDKRIALLLREARKDQGLTQAQVAEVLGWRQTDVSKMEAGRLKPSVVELENFALMCSKPLDYFATWQAQFADDKGKKSLAIAEDKFQRRRDLVEKLAIIRSRSRMRKQKMGPPVEPGQLRDAYNYAMERQAIKRRQRQARIRKFPSRNT
jgi:transcriptional regulator with XRE-family HTH domain